MNLSAIKSLMAAMAESGLAEMTYSEGGWTLRLVRDPSAVATVPQPQPPIAPSPGASSIPDVPPARPDVLEAPLAGMVYFRPAPDAAPFVEVGSKVRAGDPLCVIEAMKVFNTVRAEHDGVIAAILVASGSEVEAGQPLLRLT
jgi:acetyl-CoA carboxylase biotin carboxyl carrier protein